jgi:hypothetical protein
MELYCLKKRKKKEKKIGLRVTEKTLSEVIAAFWYVYLANGVSCDG